MITDQAVISPHDNQRFERFLTVGPSAAGPGESTPAPDALQAWAASPPICGQFDALRNLTNLFLEFRYRDNVRASLNAIQATLENPATPIDRLSAVNLFLRLCEAPITATILGAPTDPRGSHTRGPRPTADSRNTSHQSLRLTPRAPLDPHAASTNSDHSSRVPSVATRCPSLNESSTASPVPAAAPHPINVERSPANSNPKSATSSPTPTIPASCPTRREPSPIVMPQRATRAAGLLQCAGTARPLASVSAVPSAAWP